MGEEFLALNGRDGGADPGEQAVAGTAERGETGDNDHKDQAQDDAVFNSGNSGFIAPEAHSKSRSQATSGASAGGMG